jgi:AcrR family transcriptional regulator
MSVTAGTVFQDSHLPLTIWFRAIWQVTSQKNGISAIGLQRVLGLGSYQTAWMMMHKLRRAMIRPGRDRLSGIVEVDETYWGAEEPGLIGRLTENKVLVAIAVEEDGRRIGRIRLKTIPDVKRATLHGFSVAATRLFFERGFDHVTVDEIATAADVGRMTVFNHFPHKEDMFFDRDEEVRKVLREALLQRDPSVAPIETLRQLAHRLVADKSPFVEFSARSQGFIETIEGSETLKARARAIRDEIAQVVAVALSESIGREPTDPVAHLAAGLLLATWTVALIQAHRTFRQRRDTEEANAAFLAIVDKGTIGVNSPPPNRRWLQVTA